MKILHVCFADTTGGAAIATHRINEEMNRRGMHSSMLVLEKNDIQNPTIFRLSTKAVYINKIYQYITRTRLKGKIRFGTFSCDFFGVDITKYQVVKDADVIYLHWYNHDFVQLKTIYKLTHKLNKKVILYLHDMWAMTGGCHYSLDCDKYKIECKNCPLLYSANNSDLSNRIFRKKVKCFKRNPELSVVTPSNWLSQCASDSYILGNLKVRTIHNVLDQETFKPIEKVAARSVFNMATDKTVLLFGAATGGTDNPYKGWPYMVEAIKQLDKEKFELAIFGEGNRSEIDALFPHKKYFVGRLFDKYSLATLYSAVDVFVMPTMADNYPNTILEALSCGTPVVSTNIGGVPDLIEHCVNGYLAAPKNVEDIVKGVYWAAEAICNNKQFNEDIRTLSLKKFDAETIIKQHSDCLNELFG